MTRDPVIRKVLNLLDVPLQKNGFVRQGTIWLLSQDGNAAIVELQRSRQYVVDGVPFFINYTNIPRPLIDWLENTRPGAASQLSSTDGVYFRRVQDPGDMVWKANMGNVEEVVSRISAVLERDVVPALRRWLDPTVLADDFPRTEAPMAVLAERRDTVGVERLANSGDGSEAWQEFVDWAKSYAARP